MKYFFILFFVISVHGYFKGPEVFDRKLLTNISGEIVSVRCNKSKAGQTMTIAYEYNGEIFEFVVFEPYNKECHDYKEGRIVEAVIYDDRYAYEVYVDGYKVVGIDIFESRFNSNPIWFFYFMTFVTGGLGLLKWRHAIRVSK